MQANIHKKQSNSKLTSSIIVIVIIVIIVVIVVVVTTKIAIIVVGVAFGSTAIVDQLDAIIQAIIKALLTTIIGLELIVVVAVIIGVMLIVIILMTIIHITVTASQISVVCIATITTACECIELTTEVLLASSEGLTHRIFLRYYWAPTKHIELINIAIMVIIGSDSTSLIAAKIEDGIIQQFYCAKRQVIADATIMITIAVLLATDIAVKVMPQ